jgi:hypothetical protein
MPLDPLTMDWLTRNDLFTTAFRYLEQGELDEADWWLHPPWNRRKSRPSLLDAERLPRQHAEQLKTGMAAWLDSEGNAGDGGGTKGRYVRATRATVGQKFKQPVPAADAPPGVARWSFACFASVCNTRLSQEITV